MLTLTHALLASATLTWIMILTASNLRSKPWLPGGIARMFGNRDNLLTETPTATRADRAAKNMLENMVLFVAVAGGFALSGREPSRASLGATIFFWARVAYFPIYVAGITYVRSLVWTIALAGIGLVALAAW